MIKSNLYNKIQRCDFKKVFAKKGYAFFTKGVYNLNIIGVRANNNKVTNRFDDFIVVIYSTNNKDNCMVAFPATTEPGITYMQNPMNGKGAAILPEGQYRGTWKWGFHKNKYRALVQCKPITVYRDKNKDDKYDLDPKTFDKGMFGINIHKAGEASQYVNNWSAGCQVIAKETDYNTFINLCKKQMASGHGDTFTYTLINENDLAYGTH